MNPQCPEHNLETVIKPAGTSKKTGRPYPAFFACPWKGENEYGNYIYCTHKFVEKPNNQQMMMQAKAGVSEAETTKNKNIRWMNAMNNATLLLSHHVIDADDTNWETKLMDVAKFLYRQAIPEDQLPF